MGGSNPRPSRCQGAETLPRGVALCPAPTSNDAGFRGSGAVAGPVGPGHFGVSSAASDAALCLADLANTLHAAGRLSTRVRDAIVAGAGRLNDTGGGA